MLNDDVMRYLRNMPAGTTVAEVIKANDEAKKEQEREHDEKFKARVAEEKRCQAVVFKWQERSSVKWMPIDTLPMKEYIVTAAEILVTNGEHWTVAVVDDRYAYPFRDAMNIDEKYGMRALGWEPSKWAPMPPR